MAIVHDTSKRLDGEIAHVFAELLIRAEGAGLIRLSPSVPLDLSLLRQVLDRLAEAGVGRHVIYQMKVLDSLDPKAIRTYLEAVKAALEESPLPRYEWPALIETLGSDELAALVGVSASSIARYAREERPTPDEVAERLHFLALIVGDLRGSYNDVGVRRWFHRPRVPLDGRPPKELLKASWSPSEPGPLAVAALARSLTYGAVT